MYTKSGVEGAILSQHGAGRCLDSSCCLVTAVGHAAYSCPSVLWDSSCEMLLL